MKILLTTILLATASYAFSQTEQEIYLKWDNNQLKIERGDTSSIVLPFTLRFKEANFKQRELKWKNGNIVIPGTTKKFGSDIKLTAEDSGYYKVTLEVNEEKVVSNILGEISLPKNSVTLEISGETITLHYKMINEKEEQYTAGYIYYDALKLADSETPPEKKLEILRAYKVNLDSSDLNPFLKDFIKDSIKKIKTDAQVGGKGGAASFLTNLGNTDVTNFAAGLARFLAERTKDELNEAFFSKMKEQLNAYPELKTAFPKTVSYMDKIETYAYASILNALKDAFEMDMQNLPENLYEIKNMNKGSCNTIDVCDCGKNENCKKNPAKTCTGCKKCKCENRMQKLADFFATQDGHWLALGMYSVKEGIQSTNPAELLKSIVSSTEFDTLKTASKRLHFYGDCNITSAIELSNLISQSLVSRDDKQIWISTSELNSLLNSKTALKIYFGLLLSKELSAENKTVINFYKSDSTTITFGEILIKAHEEYTKYEPQLSSLIKNTYAAYNSTNNAVKKMIAASEKSVETDPQALYDYYRTLTSSLKPVTHNQLLIALVGKDIGASYDKVEKFLNPSVDMAYHISTKKYSAAIYDASILLSVLNDYKIAATDKKGNIEKDTEGKPIKVNYDGFKPITKSFLKYGTLISTVANAQSSDEVKNAIEASVLPVGSSSIKRNSAWSISLNGYVGGYWSYRSNQNQIPILGLSAPIGVNFSKGGLNKWFKGFSSSGNWGGLSANIQIIDLGALVNYYLLKGDTASIPNDFTVRLSNIFAPGFNLCYNFPKTPLSIAWGGQYIPTLYKYEQINGTNQLTPTNAFRMQFSVLVDIPMYNLKVWDFKK